MSRNKKNSGINVNSSTKRQRKQRKRELPECFSWYDYESPYFEADLSQFKGDWLFSHTESIQWATPESLVESYQKNGLDYVVSDIQNLYGLTSRLTTVSFLVYCLRRINGHEPLKQVIGDWIDVLASDDPFRRSWEYVEKHGCSLNKYATIFWAEGGEQDV